MSQDRDRDSKVAATRLFTYYVASKNVAAEDGAVMLCEMVGDQIETVALRVASGSMKRWMEENG